MIISGLSGSGKSTIANLIISTAIHESARKVKKKIIKIDYKNKNEELEVLYSNYHYEINTFDFKFSDMFMIIEFLRNFTKSKNIFTNSYNIIIIKNFDLLAKNIQFDLRTIIEKNINQVRFIFLVKTISKVDEAIISRCINFRLHKISNNEITSILNKIVSNKKNFKKR